MVDSGTAEDGTAGDSDLDAVAVSISNADPSSRGIAESLASVEPEEAFEEFFEGHFRTLIRQARYVGASMDEAEDAAAQAMLDAYENWYRLDDPRAWTSRAVARFYLKGKARGLDRIRAKQAREPVGAVRSDTDAGLTNWEEWQWIKQLLLDGLTHEQRQVVALVMDGLGPQEIGQAIGLAPGAVRQRLNRARKALKLMWDDGNTDGSAKRGSRS